MRPVDGVLLFLAAVVVLGVASQARVECFEARGQGEEEALKRTNSTTLVWSVFQDVLRRPPGKFELDLYVRRVEDKGLTRFALENILLNSEEYRRDVKTQSDEPQAELRRVNSEQYIIAHIVAIFADEREGRPVPQIVMPLKDVYEVLGPQDDDAFRAFLRSERYTDWERDVLMRAEDSYKSETTIDVYRLWYGELPPVVGASPPPIGFGGDDGLADRNAYASSGRGNGIAFERPSLWDGNARSCGFAQCAPSCADAGGDQRRVGDGDSTNAGAAVDRIAAEKPLRLYFDEQTDSVADPSLRWKLPSPPPPVCRTLRDPIPVQNYVVVAGALQGTPLKDVYHNDITQYELKQFIEIPRDEVRYTEEKEAHVA